MSYRIEKGVPIGKERTAFTGRWPFREMQIGDSFVEPDPDRFNAVQCSARGYRVRHGMQFRCQRFRKKSGQIAMRIWRIG